MKKIVLLLSIISTFQLGNRVAAQSKKTTRDSTTVIIFNQSSSGKTAHKRNGESNIIKIAPLGFIGGTFPLLFERAVNDFFSVQISGGLTSKNYFRYAITKESNNIKYTYPTGWDQNNTTDESEHIYNFDFRTPKLGYMFSIQPRVYFESDGLEGSFMGISYSNYRYNFQIPSVNSGVAGTFQNGPLQNEHENITDFMVHLGTQTLYDNLTLEYTTEVGIRNVKGTKYVFSSNQNPMDGFATYKQTLFNYNIGLKVGYHF